MSELVERILADFEFEVPRDREEMKNTLQMAIMIGATEATLRNIVEGNPFVVRRIK